MAASSLSSPPLHARLLPLPLPLSQNPFPAVPVTGARRVARPRHRYLATPPSRNGSFSSPDTEWCPVPPEQRPVNEYEALASSLPFSWAAGDLRAYCSRLALTGAAFALFVGLPVAAFGGRGGAGGDAVHLALGATGSGILAVTLAVVRMYLGWAYVGNRLLSATVEYEETGWYDGQRHYIREEAPLGDLSQFIYRVSTETLVYRLIRALEGSEARVPAAGDNGVDQKATAAEETPLHYTDRRHRLHKLRPARWITPLPDMG